VHGRLFSSVIISLQSTSELGGWKVLCIFKLLLSYSVKFILDKGSFVVLISYSSAFPQVVLTSLILQLSRGFSKWLKQMDIVIFLYVFLQLMLSFAQFVALRILLALFKDTLVLDLRVVHLLS